MSCLIFTIVSFALFLLLPLTPFVHGQTTEKYWTKEPIFSETPIVCIYAPNEPLARDVIKDAWVKETEIGIKSWEHILSQTEYRDADKWNIEIIKIPLEHQKDFDNSICRVEVRFTSTLLPEQKNWVGWERFDGNKSQIKLFYMEKEICGYTFYREYDRSFPDFCYDDEFTRSKEIGNIASHEFGHSMGLGHYESSDPRINYEWSIDPYASPSIMTLSIHYDELKNQIRPLDVTKVKEIYGSNGFGELKQTITREFSILEEKNYGGFDSFFVPSSEYIKERGNTKWITIGGMVSEQAFSKGQNILLTVEFPDGEKEEWKVLATTNRQFGAQMIVNEETQVGEYFLEAKYMGYDSEKISFSILDGMTNTIQPKKETSIPNWIRNNAKWWASGTIEDRDFVMGVQYLAQQKIIRVENTYTSPIDPSQEIPEWIRNNAKWWGDGLITDSDFVKGVQYLAQQGIIQVN